MSGLADRLRTALSRGGGEALGDLHELVATPGVAAAVLVAVTDRPAPGVLLTLRQPHLRRHAGQIAFPGGRVDPDDADAVAAALREAEEEIGLPRSLVDLVGTSDRYRTITGYDVLPVIGVIPPDLALKAQEAEVADIFEVPLAFLLARENHGRGTIESAQGPRHYHQIAWLDRRIWGATAAMIVNLAARLAGVV